MSEAAVQRCLRFLRAIDSQGGQAGRWDLIKVAGNEAAFKRWVDDYFLEHHFLEKVEKDGKTTYVKTQRGRVFQSLLEDYGYVTAFKQVSGRKLRSIMDL